MINVTVTYFPMDDFLMHDKLCTHLKWIKVGKPWKIWYYTFDLLLKILLGVQFNTYAYLLWGIHAVFWFVNFRKILIFFGNGEWIFENQWILYIWLWLYYMCVYCISLIDSILFSMTSSTQHYNFYDLLIQFLLSLLST